MDQKLRGDKEEETLKSRRRRPRICVANCFVSDREWVAKKVTRRDRGGGGGGIQCSIDITSAAVMGGGGTWVGGVKRRRRWLSVVIKSDT